MGERGVVLSCPAGLFVTNIHMDKTWIDANTIKTDCFRQLGNLAYRNARHFNVSRHSPCMITVLYPTHRFIMFRAPVTAGYDNGLAYLLPKGLQHLYQLWVDFYLPAAGALEFPQAKVFG